MHRLSIDNQAIALMQALSNVGCVPEEESAITGLVYYRISEDDPGWGEVERQIHLGATPEYFHDVVWTEFTQRERDEADYLRLRNCWTHGYPQPEELPPPGSHHLPFETETYDLNSYCPACCCGARQRAPFLMKREPSWGRRAIMKLNWVDDEIFVRRDVWEAVFKPLGVDGKQVLHYRTKTPLKTVVQLAISEQVTLEETKGQGTVCAQCGRLKYPPVYRGFFPAPVNMNGALAKSREYFGARGSAFNEILVSKGLYQQILAVGLKGAEFEPCREASAR